MLRLCIKESTHLLVLYFVQDALQKFLEVVLPHYSLFHSQKGLLCVHSNILTGILQVISELDNQLVGALEKQDVIAHASHQLAEALADPQPL